MEDSILDGMGTIVVHSEPMFSSLIRICLNSAFLLWKSFVRDIVMDPENLSWMDPEYLSWMLLWLVTLNNCSA